MECLHCGDCCLRLSLLSAPEPCPKLVQDGDFYFCGDYENRPVECQKHDFPTRFCPVGIEKLKLGDPLRVSVRIDEGWEKTKLL
jgi:hypothetical protein